jgi:hypothetical protein
MSSAEVRLPSLAPFTPHAIDINILSNCYSLGRLSSNILPTLTEVTFYPYSLYCYSFIAIVRDGYNRRGVSFSQVARLIESIGYIGKIDDFTIKLIEQYSFLLTSFSRHTLSWPLFVGATLSTTIEPGGDHVDATRTRP